MKVIVTGANGQLALTLADLYKTNFLNIHFDFFTKKELDISDSSKLEDAFTNKQYAYCVNCAAYTNVEGAETDRDTAFEINAIATKKLAETCKKFNITLIHISTDYVFDGKKRNEYLEDDPVNPINVYGKSKLKGEQYIREVLDRHFIIRVSWLYSAYGNNFVKTIVRKIKEGSQMTIITSQKGTPTSCIDLSHFILEIINSNNQEFGTYHFSASGNTTWHGFAQQIASNFPEYDSNKITAIESYETKAKRPSNSIMDISKASVSYLFKSWRDSVNEVVGILKLRDNNL